MWGRRTTVAAVAVCALATGCHGKDSGPVTVGLTHLSSGAPSSSADVGSGVPAFHGRLRLRVGSALHVYGLGCRQLTAHDRCTRDGAQTYTLVAGTRAVTLTRARMRLVHGGADWRVTMRFGPGSSAVASEAERAHDMGGYVVLLDQHSGDVLQAVAPDSAQHGRVVVDDLDKPDAWDFVTSFVTAAAPE